MLSAANSATGSNVINTRSSQWKKQRKVASYEFSAKTLKTFMYSTFLKHAEKTMGVACEVVKEEAGGGVVDVQEVRSGESGFKGRRYVPILPSLVCCC